MKNIVIGITEGDLKIISQWFDKQDLEDVKYIYDETTLDSTSIYTLIKIISRDFKDILNNKNNTEDNLIEIQITKEQGELLERYIQCIYVDNFEYIVDKYNNFLDVDIIVEVMSNLYYKIHRALRRYNHE